MKPWHGWVLAVVAIVVFAPLACAHFQLLEPQSWLVEDNLGDPQKLGPCGGTSANSGTPTNAVNKVQAARCFTSRCRRLFFTRGIIE
jgi:hypothetical protein